MSDKVTLTFEKVVDGYTHTVETETPDNQIAFACVEQEKAGYKLARIMEFVGFCQVCRAPVAGGSYLVDGEGKATHGWCIDESEARDG